jgi:hypothetical protein
MSSGVRNIVKIDMPVRWNPFEKPKEKKQGKRHIREEQGHKIQLKEPEAEVFRFRRICTEWHMGEVLNRYYLHKEAWMLQDKLSGIAPGQIL